MNEKYSDTLVQKVMKKVEELKLWQVKNDKSGFEKVYRDVLREVEELPESQEKNHALADVLMRGWWWLPGKKNDELMKRIADAAIEGKNEEVMTFIIDREDDKVWRDAKTEFIREKQIPRLEKAGFVKALGREWCKLGGLYFREGKSEEGYAAYDMVEKILSPGDCYYEALPYARKIQDVIATRYKDARVEHYKMHCSAVEFRSINGTMLYWTAKHVCNEGDLGSVDLQSGAIFRNSSMCDGRFFADVGVGETFVGSDGTTLRYVSDNETVETPAGKFEGCQLWETRHWKYHKTVCRTYYKNGIGIVRHEHSVDDVTDVRVLSAYELRGGDGLLPFSEGNTWRYASEYPEDVLFSELTFTVSFASEEKTILSSLEHRERFRYDENSWLEMVQEICNEYVEHKNGSSYLCDVTNAIERAEALAKTPMEKAHTKAAASVARRILATDTTFNPEYTATGHWNFFQRQIVQRKKDSLSLTSYNSRWSFEWKNMGTMGIAEDALLYNDILGILQDAANAIWSDEWRIGASPVVEYTEWSRDIKTLITCEDGGTITTKAGTFENCFKLCLDIGGMTDGVSYRGGKKTYYFAEGIGIVRAENEYFGGARVAVYDLTSYEGTGEGYMPMADGLVRHYDALDLTDGFVGAAEYTYVADEDGNIVIFSDRTGIRELPPPITQYAAIQSELMEEILWDRKERQETHALHALNNVQLMIHYLARPTWNRGYPDRSIGMCEFKKNLIKLFGDGKTVPPAWCALYAWLSTIQAAAFFGKGDKEKGYESLDDAYKHYQRWSEFAKGEELSLGNPIEFGNIKFRKGDDVIVTPDGKKEPTDYDYRINTSDSLFYRVLVAKSGWEWFNSVREEDRFKEYVDKAKELADKED